MTLRRRSVALAQWIALGTVAGVACGAASALFLWSLGRATEVRTHDLRIVWLLPVAGLALGALYERFGKDVRAGTNLVVDTLHDGGPQLPLRMAPMVLAGTVLTHLFGGSVGREGTAVQMGASLTDWLSHRLGVDPDTRRRMLAAGVAGGFGSVFGTPLAGTVFGLEFVVLGRVEYDALVPALVASFVGDVTARALGATHTHLEALPETAMTPLLAAKWVVFAAAVAAVTVTFITLTHAVKNLAEARIPALRWRMFAGGVAVVAMWRLSGTGDFLGLGVPLLTRSFTDAQLPVAVFALKLVFTAVTLGAGFPGGEVTPLFVIGAALGNVLARALGMPIALGAGVGLAAVFAAASNTPLALTIMAAELLGAAALPHTALVCVLAYVLTGHRSIYPSQRLLRTKAGRALPAPTRVRELADDELR